MIETLMVLLHHLKAFKFIMSDTGSLHSLHLRVWFVLFCLLPLPGQPWTQDTLCKLLARQSAAMATETIIIIQACKGIIHNKQ